MLVESGRILQVLFGQQLTVLLIELSGRAQLQSVHELRRTDLLEELVVGGGERVEDADQFVVEQGVLVVEQSLDEQQNEVVQQILAEQLLVEQLLSEVQRVQSDQVLLEQVQVEGAKAVAEDLENSEEILLVGDLIAGRRAEADAARNTGLKEKFGIVQQELVEELVEDRVQVVAVRMLDDLVHLTECHVEHAGQD